MRVGLLVLVLVGTFMASLSVAEARGGGHSYGYQGGHYAGGSGRSHRGGSYVNARTGNHYTHH